jgi:aspartyl-tRNA(Asn)/glutamyl-tRNA(Gln) amidotransferase subunit A
MSAELFRLSAHETTARIRSGDTNAREVTESYLAHIESVEPKVDAYLDVWRDPARARAEAIDAAITAGQNPGPLAGVPVAIKDNLCTREGRTTCASKMLENFESPYDATVIEKLDAAGAVLLGKLNLDEFAMGSTNENSAVKVTRNPWDSARVPGGSSGGAAACLAANEAAFTLGSDTGGSIRLPASFCGCLGMKPTYGRVSRYGLVAFASSLDQIGPFTKDAEDLALILAAIAGRDPRDATSADLPVPDYSATMRDGASGLRIGLPKEYFTDALDAEVGQQVDAALEALKGEGAELVEISLPHTEFAIAVYYIICTAEASSNLARFDGVRYGYRHPDAESVEDLYRLSKSEGFGLEVQRRILLGTYVLSSGYYDAYYLKAQKARALLRRDFNEAFTRCDVIATPTSPTTAYTLGEKMDDPLQMYLGDIFTTSANLAGIPGLSMPCGLASNGMPVGLQLLGKPFDEAALIRTAYAYEKSGAPTLGLAPLG